MRKQLTSFYIPILIKLVLIAISAKLYGQEPELWGMTTSGGLNFGTIYKMDENGENYRVIHEFGKNPVRSISDVTVEASDGLIYGAGQGGGIMMMEIFSRTILRRVN